VIDWIGMLQNELQGWFDLILGCFMFFCVMVLGEIGKIGDWLFKKED
jgi:hypothetical protein